MEVSKTGGHFSHSSVIINYGIVNFWNSSNWQVLDNFTVRIPEKGIFCIMPGCTIRIYIVEQNKPINKSEGFIYTFSNTATLPLSELHTGECVHSGHGILIWGQFLFHGAICGFSGFEDGRVGNPDGLTLSGGASGCTTVV